MPDVLGKKREGGVYISLSAGEESMFRRGAYSTRAKAFQKVGVYGMEKLRRTSQVEDQKAQLQGQKSQGPSPA